MSKPDSPRVYLIPPIIFFLCLFGGIATAVFYGGWFSPVPAAIRAASGILVVLAGVAFMAFGDRRFKSLGVTKKTFLPASQLVTAGIYRFSRNPMYVGFVTVLVGAGWAAGSIPMLASAVVMFLYLDLYVIRREEAYLARAFGVDYKTYCSRVRRWL